MYPAFSVVSTRMEADCCVFLVSGIFTEKCGEHVPLPIS